MQEKWIRVFIPGKFDSAELKSWVKENIKGGYHFKPRNFDSLIGWYGQPSVKFEQPDDAMAFKLRWT